MKKEISKKFGKSSRGSDPPPPPKQIKKNSKKVLTNNSIYVIINIEIKERGKTK